MERYIVEMRKPKAGELFLHGMPGAVNPTMISDGTDVYDQPVIVEPPHDLMWAWKRMQIEEEWTCGDGSVWYRKQRYAMTGDSLEYERWSAWFACALHGRILCGDDWRKVEPAKPENPALEAVIEAQGALARARKAMSAGGGEQ